MAELIREAERALDLQVRAFERGDSRAEQMIGLASAALVAGAGAVSAAVAGTTGPLPWPPILLSFAGSVSTLLSIGLFVRAYLGLRDQPKLRAGPSSEWLLSESRTPGTSLVGHWRTALQVHADSYTENLVSLDSALRARRLGLRTLVAGVLLFAGALFYIAVL